MREVTEQDWKEVLIPTASFPMYENVVDGLSPNFHLVWIARLYKKYRLGDWDQKVPDPDSIADKTYLMWQLESYCLFHQKHEKFGKHIIECAHPYAENRFVFFDFSSVVAAFEALDEGGATQTPYIPIYYAHPHDRHDYKTGAHLWE